MLSNLRKIMSNDIQNLLDFLITTHIKHLYFKINVLHVFFFC